MAVRRSGQYNLEIQVVGSMAGAAWAMQYEISDPAAVAFAPRLYGAIASGRGVDEGYQAAGYQSWVLTPGP